MTEPRLNHVQCLDSRGLHRMAYWEWGDAANPRVLVCGHGLSRQGRDFDTFAQAMTDHYRIVCPDVVGRGQSDWLIDPMGYTIPHYVADMVTLLARLRAETLHWVGTSMGGLIGLGLAALRESPLRKLVLNDVGPTIQADALARIGTYLGAPMHWSTLDEAADYHPAIAVPFRGITPEIAAGAEALAWAAYDSLHCPTLLVRGADSDLLSHATAQAMTQRGPKARLVEFTGVGHAPMLTAPDQITAVRQFLLEP